MLRNISILLAALQLTAIASPVPPSKGENGHLPDSLPYDSFGKKTNYLQQTKASLLPPNFFQSLQSHHGYGPAKTSRPGVSSQQPLTPKGLSRILAILRRKAKRTESEENNASSEKKMPLGFGKEGYPNNKFLSIGVLSDVSKFFDDIRSNIGPSEEPDAEPFPFQSGGLTFQDFVGAPMPMNSGYLPQTDLSSVAINTPINGMSGLEAGRPGNNIQSLVEDGSPWPHERSRFRSYAHSDLGR